MKFTKEEYSKKIAELRTVADDLLANNTPEDALEMVSRMNPVDAYILGRIIGSDMQIRVDMEAFMCAISSTEQMMETIKRGERKSGGYVLN